MMDINRNQFLLIGLVLLLLGLQVRLVDTYVLNESSTRFLARRAVKAEKASIWSWPTALAAQGTLPLERKRFQPPRWIAWALLCTGAVLTFHSFALKKPD
jgi:hypothetical protein